MKKIVLGIDKETGDMVECCLEELGNTLIAGLPGSGKSVFLRNVAKNLIKLYKPGEIGFLIFDEQGLNYRFLKDDPRLLQPVGRDIDDFFRQLDFLGDALSEVGDHRPLHYVMIIDEFSAIHGDSQCLRRLENLMDKGSTHGITFFIATQCPAFYTKKMMSASKSRLAFRHFEEDGRLFCDEPHLMELCPCPGDGLFISTNNGKKRRHCIHVE